MTVLSLGSQNAKLILLQNVTKTLLLRAQVPYRKFSRTGCCLRLQPVVMKRKDQDNNDEYSLHDLRGPH